jgi:hypothetical protein
MPVTPLHAIPEFGSYCMYCGAHVADCRNESDPPKPCPGDSRETTAFSDVRDAIAEADRRSKHYKGKWYIWCDQNGINIGRTLPMPTPRQFWRSIHGMTISGEALKPQ